MSDIHVIHSLEVLEAELVRVLYRRSDETRLLKAKTILESYRGVDWISHQRCPSVEGFGLTGYQRVSVKKHNDLFDLLILSWAPGTQSPIHDHPCERCFLMNISGSMFEERYERDNSGILHKVHSEQIPERVATWISDEIGLHSVGNNGSTLACSLHCYIPGFTTPCRIFDAVTGCSSRVSAVPKKPDRISLADQIFAHTSAYTTQFDDPGQAPVVLDRQPCDIENTFRALRCPIELATDCEPVDEQAIFRAIRSTCDLSVHTSHMFFFNQLLSKPDPVAISTDSLLSAMNVNMYDFENAPVMSLIEQRMLDHLIRQIGWSNDSACDGIFLPGASMCNFTAIHMARQNCLLKRKSEISPSQLRVFTSEESHNSIEKSCTMSGLGHETCVYVACNSETGMMDIYALKQAIEQEIHAGNVPFLINATCGTTHSGAFDNCSLISAVAKEFDCWFHVDGALGGAFVLPREEPFCRLVKGISDADSLSWNLHKLLGIPLTCSVLLTRHSSLLNESHSVHRSSSSRDRETHASSKSILSSRRADALKAWVMWKRHGDMGMANRVRLIYMHNMDFARMIRNYPMRVAIDNPTIPDDIDEPRDKNEGAFVLAYAPVSVCTCFYFIPHGLRARFRQEGPVALRREMGIVAERMKRRLNASGSIMMSHFSTKSRPHFWRIPNIHPTMTQESMWGILKLMNRIGNECFPPDIPINWEMDTTSGSIEYDIRTWKLAPEMVGKSSNEQQLPEMVDITQTGEFPIGG
jgi:glutamate/tyrosine decarboxylase-like PLP-dependent enzyme/predicted metal-dependent enzyme (double-stranded beta helix superfamily)